jgi:hypothetical protein
MACLMFLSPAAPHVGLSENNGSNRALVGYWHVERKLPSPAEADDEVKPVRVLAEAHQRRIFLDAS